MRTLVSFVLVMLLALALPTINAQASIATRKTAVAAAVAQQRHTVLSHSRTGSPLHLREHLPHGHPRRAASQSGWEGIAALVCSLVGFPVLGIVFGAMGMGKGHKHRGLAIAGFVTSIVQIAAALFFLLFIFVLLV